MIDTGEGPAVVLLHGFPHTSRLWDPLVPELSQTHRVIAPDLVAGGSALELADGMEALLDNLGVERASFVAIDAGVPPAVGFALTRPDRTERLAVMEAVLPGVPGAEEFLEGGPPWWFGFHQVPGLAETVLAGHEREYVQWFLQIGTADGLGLDPGLTNAFVAAYTGRSVLAAAFNHYRAMPETAAQLSGLSATVRLDMPVLAIGARPVGPALGSQLSNLAGRLTVIQLDDCGHLIPHDAPSRLLGALVPWLASDG